MVTGPLGRPSTSGLVPDLLEDRFVTAGAVATWIIAPLTVAAAVLVLARLTLLPGVGFWDTAELQAVGPLLGVAHPTGFPAYVILGWLASIVLQPFGEPALRMNLLSAILIASAAGLTVVLVRQLTGRIPLGATAGLVFGTMPEAWTIATHADVHALHIALVALLLLLLVGWESRRRDNAPAADRWLVAAAIAFGVALGNHLLVVLLAPGIAAYLTLVEPGIWRRRDLLARCALAVGGTAALLYLELPLRGGPFASPMVYGRPDTVVGFLQIVLGAQFTGGLDPVGHPSEKWADLVGLATYQFSWLAPLVPLGFVATLARRPAYGVLTGAGALLTLWFAGAYTNAEISRYYLVPELMAVTWVAILLDWFVDAIAGWAHRAASGGGPVAQGSAGAGAAPSPGASTGGNVMVVLAGTAAAVLLLLPSLADLPARWRAIDEHADTTAQRWLDGVFASLEPSAVVVSWWSYSTTLWYGQYIEGLRPDIFVVDDRTRLDLNLGEPVDVIDRYLGARPVYLLRLDNEGVDQLGHEFVLSSTTTSTGQPLVRVVGRRVAASLPAAAAGVRFAAAAIPADPDEAGTPATAAGEGTTTRRVTLTTSLATHARGMHSRAAPDGAQPGAAGATLQRTGSPRPESQ